MAKNLPELFFPLRFLLFSCLVGCRVEAAWISVSWRLSLWQHTIRPTKKSQLFWSGAHKKLRHGPLTAVWNGTRRLQADPAKPFWNGGEKWEDLMEKLIHKDLPRYRTLTVTVRYDSVRYGAVRYGTVRYGTAV
jgi:hypothetical protein